jgi:quercetin dioxygenase-like cupin family protein
MLAKGNVKVTDLLSATPPAIPDGSHAMTQLVELPPADAGLEPDRHSGPVFGYVLEGRIFFEMEGEEPREIVAGEAFWNLAATSCTTRFRTWTRTRGPGLSRCASAPLGWT